MSEIDGATVTYKDWNEDLFNECFNKMKIFIKQFNFPGSLAIESELADWQKKGQLLTVSVDSDSVLLKTFYEEFKQLSLSDFITESKDSQTMNKDLFLGLHRKFENNYQAIMKQIVEDSAKGVKRKVEDTAAGVKKQVIDVGKEVKIINVLGSLLRISNYRWIRHR